MIISIHNKRMRGPQKSIISDHSPCCTINWTRESMKYRQLIKGILQFLAEPTVWTNRAQDFLRIIQWQEQRTVIPLISANTSQRSRWPSSTIRMLKVQCWIMPSKLDKDSSQVRRKRTKTLLLYTMISPVSKTCGWWESAMVMEPTGTWCPIMWSRTCPKSCQISLIRNHQWAVTSFRVLLGTTRKSN